jgi:hypothetical protein
MRLHDLLAHMVVLGLPGSVLYTLTYLLTRRRRIGAAAAAGATAVISAYLISILRLAHPQAKVSISQPPSSVDTAWVTLQGTVSPPGARVFVLVHPDQDRFWWVQQEAALGTAGAWKADVSLGNPEVGGSTYYQIVVVASNNSAMADDVCNQGMAAGEQLPRPPRLPSTPMFTIWRQP